MKTLHRTAAVLLVLALLAGALAACSPKALSPTAATQATSAPTAASTKAPSVSFPLVISDDSNTQMTIKAEPQRIVSLGPSHTEILFALGLGDRVVGVTKFCDYPEEAKSKEKVGGFSDIDIEKVVSLNPDLVIASSLHANDIAPALRQKGLNVVIVDPTSVNDTLSKIRFIGQITGRSAQAEKMVNDIQARLDAVAAKVSTATSKPRVYWELDASMYSAGKGSFVDDLITRAGGDNVGTRLTGEWPQFNLESLVAADPQVIVLADHGFGETKTTVTARAGWNGIAAVKDGRVVEVEDVNIVSRPGPRVADGVEYIAKALHPDLFK